MNKFIKYSKFNVFSERLAFMYLLTHIPPFTQQVRETKNGWVSPEDWALVKIHETELQNLIVESEKAAQITFEQ